MGNTIRFGRLSKALIFAGAGVLGCSSSAQLKKQVASLETELTAVRADQDRLEERLAAVELSSTVSSRAAAQPPADRVDHPRLKVIHLSPDDEAPATEPSDDASTNPTKGPSSRRPIIRGTGDRVIKAFDGEGDESTKTEDGQGAPVAELRRDSHRN